MNMQAIEVWQTPPDPKDGERCSAMSDKVLDGMIGKHWSELSMCLEEVGRVKAQLDRGHRNSVARAWVLGRLLSERRMRMGHGEWLPYLDSVGIAQQTANQYCRLGAVDDPRTLPETITKSIAALPTLLGERRGYRSPMPPPDVPAPLKSNEGALPPPEILPPEEPSPRIGAPTPPAINPAEPFLHEDADSRLRPTPVRPGDVGLADEPDAEPSKSETVGPHNWHSSMADWAFKTRYENLRSLVNGLMPVARGRGAEFLKSSGYAMPVWEDLNPKWVNGWRELCRSSMTPTPSLDADDDAARGRYYAFRAAAGANGWRTGMGMMPEWEDLNDDWRTAWKLMEVYGPQINPLSDRPTSTDISNLARALFKAFRKSASRTGWRTGMVIPEWENLSENWRTAWSALASQLSQIMPTRDSDRHPSVWKDEVERLKDDVVKLEERVSIMQADTPDEYVETVDRMTNERDALRSQIDVLQARCRDLDNRVKGQRKEINGMSKELKAYSADHAAEVRAKRAG